MLSPEPVQQPAPQVLEQPQPQEIPILFHIGQRVIYHERSGREWLATVTDVAADTVTAQLDARDEFGNPVVRKLDHSSLGMLSPEPVQQPAPQVLEQPQPQEIAILFHIGQRVRYQARRGGEWLATVIDVATDTVTAQLDTHNEFGSPVVRKLEHSELWRLSPESVQQPAPQVLEQPQAQEHCQVAIPFHIDMSQKQEPKPEPKPQPQTPQPGYREPRQTGQRIHTILKPPSLSMPISSDSRLLNALVNANIVLRPPDLVFPRLSTKNPYVSFLGG